MTELANIVVQEGNTRLQAGKKPQPLLTEEKCPSWTCRAAYVGLQCHYFWFLPDGAAWIVISAKWARYVSASSGVREAGIPSWDSSAWMVKVTELLLGLDKLSKVLNTVLTDKRGKPGGEKLIWGDGVCHQERTMVWGSKFHQKPIPAPRCWTSGRINLTPRTLPNNLI